MVVPRDSPRSTAVRDLRQLRRRSVGIAADHRRSPRLGVHEREENVQQRALQIPLLLVARVVEDRDVDFQQLDRTPPGKLAPVA
jgi:hypothetical protein